MKRIEQMIRDGVCRTQNLGKHFYINIPVPVRATSKEALRYLLEELPEPQKLTSLEYELAKYFIKRGYKWIAVAKDDGLYVTRNKYLDELDDGEFKELYGFVNLFPFVKRSDNEPTNLQELIDNCKVVDNITF